MIKADVSLHHFHFIVKTMRLNRNYFQWLCSTQHDFPYEQQNEMARKKIVEENFVEYRFA